MQVAMTFPVARFQRRKQRGRSVALVVVGHRSRAPLLDGESRLPAVQRLNLAFLPAFILEENGRAISASLRFIAGKHHRMFRWVQVKPHDGLQLFGEVLVVGELESAA